MVLTGFIASLIEQGSVTVAGEVVDFTEEDLQQTQTLLEHCYQEDRLDMPATPPDFSGEAALYGAKYIYWAVQLIMLRDLGEQEVDQLLRPYNLVQTPAAIFSVDLCLRHLPDLFSLAKGLAPDDPMVKRMKETACQWPFSSVGMDLEGPMDHTPIWENASLQLAYIDRIIEKRDHKRVRDHDLTTFVLEALGEHHAQLWPGFEKLLTVKEKG